MKNRIKKIDVEIDWLAEYSHVFYILFRRSKVVFSALSFFTPTADCNQPRKFHLQKMANA